jgi:hypothetical protein
MIDSRLGMIGLSVSEKSFFPLSWFLGGYVHEIDVLFGTSTKNLSQSFALFTPLFESLWGRLQVVRIELSVSQNQQKT